MEMCDRTLFSVVPYMYLPVLLECSLKYGACSLLNTPTKQENGKGYKTKQIMSDNCNSTELLYSFGQCQRTSQTSAMKIMTAHKVTVKYHAKIHLIANPRFFLIYRSAISASSLISSIWYRKHQNV